MSKTKKILTTTAAVAAATTGAMVATTAHADTTATSAQAKQSTVSAQDQLNNMQAQHSQAESQMASANAAEMASATTETNSQVAKLQEQLKNNQASQAAEDAPKLASGTKVINQKAAQATAKENAAYSDAVKSQEAANKQALVDAAKNIYTPAQKQQLEKAKTSQYNQAKAKLDQAHQTKLNNLKADYDKQATKLNDQIKANQTKAQQDHDQAIKDASAKLDGQINVAQKNIDRLNDAVKADKTAVDKATTAVKNAKSNLESAKSALNNAQASQQSSSSSLPKTWVNKYDMTPEQVRNGGFTVDFENWKDTNPADQRQAQFDANGQLTGKDAIEINTFVASVLNEIRQQIGTPLLHVNQTSVETARANALEYAQKDKGIFGHDDTILNDMQNRANASAVGECMYEGGIDSQSTYESNLANIKERVYEDLIGFINDDYRNGNNGGHRKLLLGVIAPYCTYIGFNANMDGTRYLLLDLDNPVGNDYPLIGQTATPAPDLTGLTNALVAAQTKQKSAKATLDSANTKLSRDQDLLNKAQTKLTNLKNQKSKQTTDSSITDSPAVKALKDKLTSLKTKYDQDVKAENDNYNAKKKTLDDQLAKQIADIKAHPENVDQLKAENAKKLDALKQEHEAKLAKIKNDAEQQIAALKQQLADSHNDVNQPIVDQINALKTALATKQDQLNQKLADLKANDAAEYNALRDKLMPKQVVTGTANGYLTAGGQVVSLSAKSGHSASSEATVLPQTGNNSSLAAVVLGAVSMMFSFGLMKKRG